MKLARSLCLPVLAALSMASCSHWGNRTYVVNHDIKHGPDSFGGHGGGYGSGYAIWPMPTDNYALYGTFDDPYAWGDSGYYRATKTLPQPSYEPAAVTARSYK